MPARAIAGWSGTLTFKASGSGTVKTIAVRSVNISRQAAEFNLTAHGDAVMYGGPGRVKRGGTLEAYVSADSVGFVTAIETPNLASPAVLVFTDAGSTATTLNVIITGADQTHASEDAAIYAVTFTETIALT